MPPLPKKKHSRSRKGKRNAHNAIGSPALSVCKGCDSVIQPHRICMFCGNYKTCTRLFDFSGSNPCRVNNNKQ